jgi:hypothetical protein
VAPRDPEVARARARLAAVRRHHPDQVDLTADARRDLRVANAGQYIRDLVDTWPPLSAEQRGRLAALLASGGQEGADDEPPDGRSRQSGQLAAPRTPDDTIARSTTSLADRGDGADPRAVGDLLGTWLGVKFDQVDALVDEARGKVDSIPDMRVLASIVGEQFILLRALETEVDQLRGEVARLRQRGRAA